MTDEKPSSQPYSKDYWDMVLEQLRRRPTVRLAVTLLVLLYATAIYAPFLANDRPLVFTGTDYGSYRSAWRVVANAARDLTDKAAGGGTAFAEWQAVQQERSRSMSGPSLEEWRRQQPQDLSAWLEIDRDSLALRVRIMSEQLGPDDRKIVDELVPEADLLVAACLSGDDAARAAASDQLLANAEVVRSTLKPAKYDEAPEPGSSVALVPMTRYPVAESLSPAEIYFMGLWALVLTWPLWNRLVNGVLLGSNRAAIRTARRLKLACVLLLPALAVLGWQAAHGDAVGEFQATSMKEALQDDKARSTHVTFPPVAFGMAEQNDPEKFRPPTWSASAAMDEKGFYPGEGAVDEQGRVVHRTPIQVRVGEPDRNAGNRHPLGADSLGRDILARMVWGGRISLSVGLISTALLVLIGTFLGALAGYFGGWVDVLISRIIEIFQCFPVFFLILIVVSFVGPSVLNIMLAIGIFRWTGVARLVRGEFIRLRGLDFVVASEALGVRNLRTIFRHVLPNAIGPVLVAATFAVASGILTESALSFLGFGVKMPIPSWGSLLNESRNPEHWWIQVFPGLAVFVTVILYNLVGEGVRDALDPRLKER